MFWSPEKKPREREKTEKSVNDKLLQLEVYGDQTNVLADKVDRLAEDLKSAASEDAVTKSYDDVINAGTGLAEALEKEEKKTENPK
ncbi:MAG: hypothetical protein Q7R90_02255 [bacterium]|nr:hypothetical protein [bacterium]